ncbi:MAG: aldo/keto reductase [Candidatus Dormibacteria bacterium]
MRSRRLGRTGYTVSEIGFGAWAIGADWGTVDDATSLRALHAAADAGVTFYDTADVYGDGRSERLIGRFLRERSGERLIVATKIGRRAPLAMASYTPENLRAWVDRCRDNLGVATLDLVQLHCLPTDIYYHPELFAALDELQALGAVAHHGVSVERVEEGLKAIEFPGVATVQVVYNMLRQRPAESLLPQARARDVGIIVRVPLASGLLTGRLRPDTRFEPSDHRSYNRHGEAFDASETFSGVDYDLGLAAVERLRTILPDDAPMSGQALRWILMNECVSTVIPGAKTAEQAAANAASSDLPDLDDDVMAAIAELYRERIAPLVHQRW